MSTDASEDMEDLGNEALVFCYGHNVNLYRDVFEIAQTSSTKEIWLTYTGLLKESEVAMNAFLNYDEEDENQKHYAKRLGMKPSHFAVGMHPRDYLEIKTDAVHRAYQILANHESRTEYDECLREHLESSEGTQGRGATYGDKADYVTYDSDAAEHADEAESNDGKDSLYDASSLQGQADFPLLSSHHTVDVFDPFNLEGDLRFSPGFSDLPESEWTDTSTASATSFPEQSDDWIDASNSNPPAPVSPDVNLALSFTGMHPHGHETSVRLCALPTVESDDSSVESEYIHDFETFETAPKTSLDSGPNYREEDDGLVSFRLLSKSHSSSSALDEKQAQFFSQMDLGLDNVECFSDDEGDDLVEHDDAEAMSVSSLIVEKEVDEYKEDQEVWNCWNACIDEVHGTLDDTALTVEQLCGMKPLEK